MRTAYLIYFSPTGTTRKISECVAEGVGLKEVIHHDLTLPSSATKTVLRDGVAIIGAPVYAGRVPELFLRRLQNVTAKNVPAVLVALYGNRAFEDALVELRDATAGVGFQVLAAGAFIGEHSFSIPAQPIAAGRPDGEDLRLAVQFGRQAAAKLERRVFDTLVMAGNLPYKERLKLGGMAPETDQATCRRCGTCVTVCPAGIITMGDSVSVRADNCIMCCACVRACNTKARAFSHPRMAEMRTRLEQSCAEPKKTKIFM